MIPDLTIIIPAAHPELWMTFYNSIGPTSLSYEIIFLGPNAPSYALPDNCRFRQLGVKPPQCFEIGLRECASPYVQNFPDDFVFLNNIPLDRMMANLLSYDDPKIMVSTRYKIKEEGFQIGTHTFWGVVDGGPIIPVCGMCKTQTIKNLGGTDRNFIALFWDVDIALRLYEAGGRVELSDVTVQEIRDKAGRDSIANSFYGPDRALLEELWLVEGAGQFGKVSSNRKRPVEPFTDKDIQTISQGPRGKW